MADEPTPAELTAHMAALEADMAKTTAALEQAEHAPVGEPTPPRCDCPALPVPHVHLQGGPAPWPEAA